MSIQGKLATMSLADVLQWLHVDNKTGVLKITLNKLIRSLVFDHGEIINVITDEPTHDPLDYLFKQGVLSPKQVEKLTILRKVTNESSLILIHDLELIPIDALKNYIRSRFQEIIMEIMEWKQGVFTFFQQEEHNKLPFEIEPVSTMEIIMESGRRKDEWQRIHEVIPSLNLILDKTPEFIALTGMSSLAKKDNSSNGYRIDFESNAVKKIFSLVNGRSPIYEICENTGLSEFQTCYLLWHLILKGYLTITGELPGPRPSVVLEYLSQIDALIKSRKFLEAEAQLNELRTIDSANEQIEGLSRDIHRQMNIEKAQLFSRDNIIPRMRVALNSPELRETPMTSQEGFLISRIDGRTQLKNILTVSGLSKDDSLNIIYKFYKKGVIEFHSLK